MSKPHLVVLTGAGISAESGIPTFRDSGGLWEGYDVMEVATPQGWQKDQGLVLEFYNQRRKAAQKAEPNRGHRILKELEEHFSVSIITQNIDNLHERAGSSKVLHLHGELFKSQSTIDPSLVYDIEGWALNLGDTCEKGSQLRPNVVWFGEMVPAMERATQITSTADICVIIGTSMVVYPAAGLMDYVPVNAPIYVVDPNMPEVKPRSKLHLIENIASKGLEKVKNDLMNSLEQGLGQGISH